jgi:hypothetical protein
LFAMQAFSYQLSAISFEQETVSNQKLIADR